MIAVTKTLIFSFLFVISNLQAQNSKDHISYYGKNLNSMLRTQLGSSSAVARARTMINIDPEVLRNEIFRVLSFNHIEKADQGFDAIVNECNSTPQTRLNCYKHGKNEYTYSRGFVYNDLDRQTATSQTRADYVVDVYCKQIFKFSGSANNSGFQNSRTSQSSSQKGFSQENFLLEVIQPLGDINIEHTWPQSKFTKQFPGDLQKGDLHHLYPSNAKANSIRGNHPFGEVENEDHSVANCPSRFGINAQGDQVYEPVDDHKGNVARALFYFSVRYQIAIDPTQEEVLKRWHKLDPVDDAERERNDRIFKIQKNRNPFVDFPELALVIKDY
jgi:deoxyribonuclease-1